MATTTPDPYPPSLAPQASPLSLKSHDTALALVPPRQLWPRVDRLRALYDKAYPRWPPHVNLVYPFVGREALPEAVRRVAAGLSSPPTPDDGSCPETATAAGGDIRLRLDRVGVFERKREKGGNTLFLCDGDGARTESVRELRRRILKSLAPGPEHHHPGAGGNKFEMHLTVAQSEDVGCAAHKFLVEKIGLVPALEWTVGELAVLLRERVGGDGSSVMRLWGTIGIADGRVERFDSRLGVPYDGRGGSSVEREEEEEVEDGDASATATTTAEKDSLQTRLPYYFEEEAARWVTFIPSALDAVEEQAARTTLAVASYNVLAEFEWPPSETRYPLLVRNILADSATADVLVLQEVTDGFLSHLLADARIRDAYPFCSHGPPDQDDIEPLPSFLNVVVLSKLAFEWEYVSFHRKHKGAVVAKIKDVGGRPGGDRGLPIVLAAVHLSHGLTDGAVAAKKADIKRIIGYVTETYPRHPWILAGDFNITTSSASIDEALKKSAISDVTAAQLRGFGGLFAEAKLEDAWGISMGEGERGTSGPDSSGKHAAEGATWDPTVNGAAAAMAGSGGSVRPQRYDRILVRGEDVLQISGFNTFGFLTEASDDPRAEAVFASDHWGVRCTMAITKVRDTVEGPSEEVASLVVPVRLASAPEHLGRPGSVEEALLELGVIPTAEETARRKAAFELLKAVLLDAPAKDAERPRPQPTVVVVPVGSYALEVWTSSSDMDVLCIGPFTSRTFFALASQRLRRAAPRGVRIVRRVRANTGTMLELEVDGIKVDLQYCPAAAVAERWPDVLGAPASDPVWSLPAQTLAKLKAVRDADYLRRSVPDPAAFRLAHRFIKTWARSRGIYSARFGFLGGIQISILLARVQKLLLPLAPPPSPTAAHGAGRPVAVEHLLATFFAHYASFNWSARPAFDPLFHRRRLPYTRTPREPLAILGYFPPALNTALAASVPSVRTLAGEFRRAAAWLASSSSSPASWSAFLTASSTSPSPVSAAPPSPASAAGADFLSSYRSYVRLDVQYWGLSRARGARLLGWLESRCAGLLVDLHRRAPGVHVRMWPGRFVEVEHERKIGEWQEQEKRQEEGQSQAEEFDGGVGLPASPANETGSGERDFRGCYLIGLERADPSAGRDELRAALGAVQTSLARFEAQMRGDAKYFDARSCWLSAAVVNRAELGDLELDGRGWGEYTAGEEEEAEEEDEDDDEEEEWEEEKEEEEVDPETQAINDQSEDGSQNSGDNDNHRRPGTANRAGKKKRGASRRQTAAAAAAATVDLRADKAKKFRTAADVMNRLRWDPQLDSGDYVVGYEDRFVGTREKELEAWTGEQTDEEFIPQHRILYFRRKSDGRKVWDRRTRRDELFGNR